MALLLETNIGDLVIDLDVEGSPELCKNVLKLAKARYYTSTLIYNIQANRFCQLGDPQGDGKGGACIHALIEDGPRNVLQSQRRFLKSNMGRPLTEKECREKGRVVATEMNGIADTIGSQLLITTCEGPDMALDGFSSIYGGGDSNGRQQQTFRSIGVVTEDENNVLDQIASAYCDADGRPYADIRIRRALIIDDPFEDPPGLEKLLSDRGVIFDDYDRVIASPEYEKPEEEQVDIRIPADQIDPLTGEEDVKKMREQEAELLKREDKSRAVVLEMLGDLPDADIEAPDNVLFVCKLNPVTEDEDLELIFSRFDEKVKAEIIRDQETGNSLQYAFVEFTTKEQATEAYFKMNNALVDDRRIKVDFSQSVAKVWNKYTQRMKNPAGKWANEGMPKDPFSQGPRGAPRNNRGHERPDHRFGGRGDDRRGGNPHGRGDSRSDFRSDKGRESSHQGDVDQFGRQRKTFTGRHPQGPDNMVKDRNRGEKEHQHNNQDHRSSRSRSPEEWRRRRRERSRSRSRSRDRHEKRHRKHRKHHKSKRDRKGHEGRRSRDRSQEKKRRHRNDDESGLDDDGSRDFNEKGGHKLDDGSRENDDYAKRHRKKHRSKERHRSHDRRQRESSPRSRSRGDEERHQRGRDETDDRDRRSDKHDDDKDRRSRHHKKRDLEGSLERKERKHRDKRDDRKRRHRDQSRSVS